MAISPLATNLNIVAALADLPNATDGLTAAQLKAKFDEASGILKDYINNTVVSQVNSHMAANGIDAHGTMPAARVYHNVDQSISHNTLTALAFNSERFDTDTIHDTATNNSRLTCKTAGKYNIIGQVTFASSTTGLRSINIKLNGATIIAFIEASADNSGADRLQVTTLYDLAVNDYVELVAFQASGEALNVRFSSASSPEFMMVKVG